MRSNISSYDNSISDTVNTLAERAIRILEYCECPQYLRRELFKRHSDLQYAGVLYPLTTPHHYRREDEEWTYREGVVNKERDPIGKCSYVDVGLKRPMICDRKLKAGVRITVKRSETEGKTDQCVVVSPNAPFEQTGTYWGYRVRFACTPDEVIHKSIFNEPYDLTIGTSDRGMNVDDIMGFNQYHHALIVFGGLHGLEAFFKSDNNSLNASEHFDFYLNTCPGQGTRTIRMEEALSISLSIMRPLLHR